MKRMPAPASTTRKLRNNCPPSCSLTDTSRDWFTSTAMATTNSRSRSISSIPVTAQLRTDWRSSLMTMGFNSQSRQLAK
jgi:hypothetical protein